MCSIFCPIMDNYQGDLTDIVRASGSGAYHGSFSSAGNSSSEAPPFSDWNFASDPMNFSSVGEESRHNFGFPFSNRQDPLLHELHIPGSSFVNSISSGVTDEAACGTTSLLGQKILEDDMRRPCNNIFSNLIQISPNAKLPISPCGSPVMTASPRAIKPSAVVSDNTEAQISSSRNPGLKRRKSQVKKVVCIPAPTAANSRPSCGEVVPSDLWAWRKYGQKPIKGSPYPRGYYRCSSSKGCSARKQVERSRTDPNMLVITYTSEHNHPWPTQRNALAGSTRSYSSKTNAAPKNSESTHPQKATIKPNDKEQLKNNSDSNVLVGNSGNNASVKEEMEEDIEKQAVVEMDDREFSDGLPYKSFQSEDFFAELEEIEADPLNLLFSDAAEVQKESMALDPSHLFDWSADTTLFEGYNKTLKKLP